MEILIINIFMQTSLFYLFSILTLVGGLCVIISRNAVNSAMYMILAFASTAGLFFLLESFFVGILQILVYAGAVMVLFLFVIMLLDVEEMAKRRPSWPSLVTSIIGLMILTVGVFYLINMSPELSELQAPEVLETISAQAPFAYTTSSKSFGYGLFTKYMLPLQVAGFLLLIAIVGIVVVSKKHTVE
ncbi:MAG: hypothetical protein C5B43_04400 [Verrucomicrobia bacterium]|nr:MAG: hypothetical protein C5B43_04400 [Verrucomicrobiota bacterium]